LFAPRNGNFVDPRLPQPATIFASGVGKSGKSLRPPHSPCWTCEGDRDLARRLIHQRFRKRLSSRTTCPQKRHGARFDMVWVLDANWGSGWSFAQVPQLLLSGDSDKPVT
jgi:hypothetical protein